MRAPTLRHAATALLAIALLSACGERESADPAPRPLGEGPPGETRTDPAVPPAEPADAAAEAPADPRMLLFDVQTALESARPTQDGYPVADAFMHEERWRLHRQRLDDAFDEWTYESDGESFQLRGVIGGRAYDVSGP